jgi:hypothetical protein
VVTGVLLSLPQLGSTAEYGSGSGRRSWSGYGYDDADDDYYTDDDLSYSDDYDDADDGYTDVIDENDHDDYLSNSNDYDYDDYDYTGDEYFSYSVDDDDADDNYYTDDNHHLYSNDYADGWRADQSNLTRWDLELNKKVHEWVLNNTAASWQYGSIGE